jgi:thiol:disulfide interchange protein
MPMLNRLLLISFLVALTLSTAAQILEPVKWSFSTSRTSLNEAEIIFTASIIDGWYLYSQHIPDDGPIPTSFTFEESSAFTLMGKVIESDAKEKFDDIFKMDIKYFLGKPVFRQKIKPLINEAFKVTGYVEFMSCDNNNCTAPTTVDFELTVPAFIADETAPVTTDRGEDSVEIVKEETVEVAQPTAIKIAEEMPLDKSNDKSGLWYIFFAGLVGGLLALLTPCVFPMIPMTVSYFIRNTSNKAKGRRDAFIYGISIVIIYVTLGLGVSLIFGSDGLNQLSTSPWFNLFFFALLIVFAAAFFGAFELQLPSSWTNAIDNKAEKTGGFVGVFLMALVLVLVSFSCTGPIIGTLLVEAATSGSMLSPMIGMTGFSIALAIPFTLLAIFPSMMGSIPKSGGWLNSVKVVLAFLLLAFSLKFLTVADSVAQWNLMSRDVFLAIWITIFTLMGFYLLGKIKFHHDSDLPYVSVPRIFLVIIVFSFVAYLIPGMWGAPLTSISSFAPPVTTQVFDVNRSSGSEQGSALNQTSLLPEGYHTKEGAYGLVKFLEYDEGLEYARKAGKPIFLDFTGHGCVNCRKMEAAVWSDPQVLQRLRNEYVIISLYVDDRTRLSDEEQYTSDFGGRERRIRTIGNKWSDFQAKRYGVNSQPYYVLLNHQENQLAQPYSYNTNTGQFVEFLDKGIEAFRQAE